MIPLSIFLIFLCYLVSPSSLSSSPPKLSAIVPLRFQNAGSKFKIACFAEEGQKPFEFEWRQNNEKILMKPYKYQIDIDDDTSNLAILNLDAKDSANYSCTVRNEYGFDSQTTRLIVKGIIFPFSIP
ncbi:hypothetical protein BLA29_013355 [Euroglyphus maynei]|uniref:Ig-like domain-containing protein n=1 Tax=Euroglyphus maynei TaxID=6958 RepID=A0A1Y3BA39_EURMA|nr:hypothetical protein BLA29_013355 [Euroglyphus maynei]